MLTPTTDRARMARTALGLARGLTAILRMAFHLVWNGLLPIMGWRPRLTNSSTVLVCLGLAAMWSYWIYRAIVI